MNILQSDFDDLFDIVRENIDRGWRDFKVNNAHIATIVYQKVLLECTNDDSLSAVKSLDKLSYGLLATCKLVGFPILIDRKKQ